MHHEIRESLTVFMGEVSQLNGMALILEEYHEPAWPEPLPRQFMFTFELQSKCIQVN
jgi:hypothetical protein